MSFKINPSNSKFQFKTVERSTVLAILKSLKVSKSAGPDNLPACVIRDAAEELSEPIQHLANLSFTAGLFATSEKCAKVSPVYKADERSSFDNYRPLSVLKIMSEVLERIAYQQLPEYLEMNNLLNTHQYGFRRKRSTQQADVYLTEHIRQNKDKGHCTGAAYLDLRKAFDTVNHACLLNKLPSYGIHGIE